MARSRPSGCFRQSGAAPIWARRTETGAFIRKPDVCQHDRLSTRSGHGAVEQEHFRLSAAGRIRSACRSGGVHVCPRGLLGCKDAVVARLVRPRPRDQGSQPRHEVLRRELHMRRAVAERALQPVAQQGHVAAALDPSAQPGECVPSRSAKILSRTSVRTIVVFSAADAAGARAAVRRRPHRVRPANSVARVCIDGASSVSRAPSIAPGRRSA